MSTFSESAALDYPLFADDFGAPGDRILTDEIRTCRKPRTCCECLGPVQAGTRYRYHVAVYDGAMRCYSFCTDCCAAMAINFDDDGAAMEVRWALRAERGMEAKE